MLDALFLFFNCLFKFYRIFKLVRQFFNCLINFLDKLGILTKDPFLVSVIFPSPLTTAYCSNTFQLCQPIMALVPKSETRADHTKFHYNIGFSPKCQPKAYFLPTKKDRQLFFPQRVLIVIISMISLLKSNYFAKILKVMERNIKRK